MNPKTLDQAKSVELRGSWLALQRAAQRARELAAQTGTELIVSRQGVVERVAPRPQTAGHKVQAPSAPYGLHGKKP